MSKKMYPEDFCVPKNREWQSSSPCKNGVAKALAYTPPQLRNNKAGCYIEFHAYDPLSGAMRRKRIKINRIHGARTRKQFATEVIRRVTDLLRDGWSPWINSDPDNLQLFAESIDRFEDHVQKSLSNGVFRKQTYDDYKSKIKILRTFVERRKVRYLFQFDKRFCVDFLDYVYLERNNGPQTFNNYLTFLRMLSQWWLERGWIDAKPTDGLSPISRRLYHKERTCIPLDVVRKIGEWGKENDPHFAFACQLLYYCFIRPVEMTRLRIQDFHLNEGTMTIHADASKNRKTQHVTVPRSVLLYGISLGVFNAAMTDYVFSSRLRPGTEQIDPKIFRDHWAKVSKALKLKKEWKFYSLKDTGITEMLNRKMGPKMVKDQARHSSLAITELYLGEVEAVAVPEIAEIQGPL